MNDLLHKNQLLTRANVKHVTKIRSLENQVKSLQQQLLNERVNQVPLGHVQDVCLAAIDEFDALQEQFKIKSRLWNSHARVGLEAICALQHQHEKMHSFSETSSVFQKPVPGPVIKKKPGLYRSGGTKKQPSSSDTAVPLRPLGKIDENIAISNRFSALDLSKKVTVNGQP